MPRDGSNIYHRPAGTDGVPNFPIESSKYNAYVADVEQDLNLPRPIVAGGTGATSADGALTNLSAEKAAQIVTNWDSMVWMAGSYYAATTATGIAPVAGHAFAGIAYVSNATLPITDMVLEATDVTDSANPDQYIRTMAAGVWGPWTRVNPNISSANLGEYTFNNQVTFPPTAGQIRFNNATENSTTEVFISHLTATGFDNSTQITSYLTSGVDFAVQDKDEGNKYKIFTTTAAVVLSGGDFRVTVALKIAGLDVVSAQRMLVTASSETQRVQQRQLIYAAPFDALAYNGMQVNGSMEVSQENGLSPVTVSATDKYVVDGWACGSVGAQIISATKNTGASNYPPGYSCSLAAQVITTANPSPAASDRCTLYQPIEGYRITRLGFGTSSAISIAVAFWIKANVTGMYSGTVTNGAADRRYAFTFTVNASATWEYKTITIPGDTTGTWTNDNSIGIRLHFAMMCGASAQGTPNVWGATSIYGATGTVNACAAISNYMLLAGVIVLPGIEAPSAARSPLIMRPYDQELVTCKRYFYNGLLNLRGIVGSAGTSLSRMSAPHPVTMRGSPSITAIGSISVFDGAVTTTIPSFATNFSTPIVFEADANLAAGMTAGRTAAVYQASGSINVDARL